MPKMAQSRKFNETMTQTFSSKNSQDGKNYYENYIKSSNKYFLKTQRDFSKKFIPNLDSIINQSSEAKFEQYMKKLNDEEVAANLKITRKNQAKFEPESPPGRRSLNASPARLDKIESASYSLAKSSSRLPQLNELKI